MTKGFKQHLLDSTAVEAHNSLNEANIVFDKLKQIQDVTSNIDISTIQQLFKDTKEQLSTSVKDMRASDFKSRSIQLVSGIELTIKSFLNFKHIIKTGYLDDSIIALSKLAETLKQYTTQQIRAYHSSF